jgi:Tol biopolymer transport system component
MATVAWSPDGTKLVTGEADLFEPSDVYVWDVASQTRIAKIGEHAAQAQTWVTWSPDGQLITSIGGDEWLRIYDTAQEYREVQTLEKGMMLITDYGFSPYGGRLVYGAPLHDGQGLNDTDSAFSNGAVRVVVPVPSLARLDYIAPLCIVSSDSTEATRLLSPEAMETLTVEILPDFIAQVEALPERAIPAGCATDLIAVAEAVYSSQKNN